MRNNMTGTAVEILLVEDNPGDRALAVEALRDSKINNHLHVAVDGEEAMNFLNKSGNFRNAETPDIVFLDLNLPKKDGREILAEIKNNPRLKSIPVVVLTTSSAEEDIIRSYDLHANCYISKPLDFNQFVKVVKSIEDFWLTIVKLPPKKREPHNEH
ncbi:MAG: response regulator [Ignavibacteriae bacterium]|nr:response regulator [Ignavibacteriota bacterium]